MLTPLLPTTFSFGDSRAEEREIVYASRVERAGIESLEDNELLDIVLRGAQSSDSLALAEKLLSEHKNLGGVISAKTFVEEQVDGLAEMSGPKKDNTPVFLSALKELLRRILLERVYEGPIIGSHFALFDYLKLTMAYENIEHLRVLFLNGQNKLIREDVTGGVVNHAPFYVRELVKRALELEASGVIIVHNHPSGDPTPSNMDIEQTRGALSALKAVDVTLHDHLIIGKGKYASFRQLGLI